MRTDAAAGSNTGLSLHELDREWFGDGVGCDVVGQVGYRGGGKSLCLLELGWIGACRRHKTYAETHFYLQVLT